MTKIAFTVSVDPASVGKLVQNPVPGIKVTPPRATSFDGQRGEIFGFITNVEVNLVINVSLVPLATLVGYLVGRLHGNAKVHLNQRTIGINDPQLIEAELKKLEQRNKQQE